MLYLNHNKFEGSLDFTRLPERLEELYVNDNVFSGEIDVSRLPVSLITFDARNNRLSGTVHRPLGLLGWKCHDEPSVRRKQRSHCGRSIGKT